MKSKILSKKTLLIIILTILALLLFSLLYYFNPERSAQNVIPPPIGEVTVTTKPEQPISGLPIRLKIPGINVDAAIEQVGLTAGGAMDVPKNQNNVAWYSLGQRPGEIGSAVIAGHFDWKNGLPAVFYRLDKLQKGDKIYVEDDRGATITFVVRESRNYDPKADASDVFISNDGKSHLNLITCEGIWSKAANSYSKRLVVFSDKE